MKKIDNSRLRKKRIKDKGSRVSYIILFTALLFSAILLYDGIHGISRISMCDSRIAFTKSNIEKEKARLEALNKKEKFMKTDKFIEETARAKLGLVKDNEIIFDEK